MNTAPQANPALSRTSVRDNISKWECSPSIEARFDRLEIELDLFIARERMWKRAQIHADLEFAEIEIQKAFNILEHPESAEVHSVVASSRIQLLIKRLERAKQTIYAHA